MVPPLADFPGLCCGKSRSGSGEREKLAERAYELGKFFRAELRKIQHPMLKLVRGKGLLNAIVVEPMNGYEAWDVCLN